MVEITTGRSIVDLPDIAYYVVSHLDPGGHSEYEDGYIVRQSLARLARTCRDFTRPALRMLWKHLPDDQPLADLLCTMGIAQRHRTPNARPSATTKLARFEVPTQLHPGLLISPSQREAVEKSWKSLRGYNDQYTLRHAGDPSAHPRWEDFEKCASYVRAIVLFAFDGPKWSEVWQELVSRLGPRPILPNLQSVSLNAVSPHKPLSASAFLLVSPSVTTLHFSAYYDITGVHAALPAVSDRAPNIDTLRLSVLPWEGMHANCPRLSRISIVPPLDGRQLQYLCNFSDLRSLSISLADPFALTDQLALPSVESLRAKGTWSCLTGLLTATNAPSLSALTLEVWESGTPAQQVAKDATDCLRAVSASHASLTSLTVQASYGRAPSPSGARFILMVQGIFKGSILDVAHPLLALHDLRTLTLVLPDYLDLDCPSEDLRAMVEAWRDLEELHVEFWEYFAQALVKPPREVRPRGGPLGALTHFARNCPRLRTLRLPPMDATTTIGMGDELLTGVPSAHGLERLVVSKVKVSPQDDTSDSGEISSSLEWILQFVGRVFPKAAWAFRKERLAVVDGWAVAHETTTYLASANVNKSVSSISSITMRQRSTENPDAPEVIEKYLVVRFS